MVRSKQIMVQSSINHDSESIIIYMIIIIINHDSEDIGCFCKLCWLSKSDPGLASNILQDHHRHYLVHLEIIKDNFLTILLNTDIKLATDLTGSLIRWSQRLTSLIIGVEFPSNQYSDRFSIPIQRHSTKSSTDTFHSQTAPRKS